MRSEILSSRRGILTAGLAALGARSLSGAPGKSIFRGVSLGVQSRSFQDRLFDEAIAAMAHVGFSLCELSGVHFQPQAPAAEARKWRLNIGLDHFAKLGAKLRQAGIDPEFLTFNLQMTPPNEAEVARGFELAQAFGAKAISCSTKLSVVPALDAAAKRFKMRVGLHNHSVIRSGEITTPDDFAAALRGRSDYIAMTLDIGHFTAAGFDPLQWFRQNRSSVLSLHIKDRKKEQGPNVPFGEGDTPIASVLRYTRDQALDIPALIEYEYKGSDALVEVTRCFDYCRTVLLS
jgi:sugar phosphate isomerase/epimerase